ncbi:hypothetical protein BH09BAC1_BH09BAC1_20000 [soil metagenome]
MVRRVQSQPIMALFNGLVAGGGIIVLKINEETTPKKPTINDIWAMPIITGKKKKVFIIKVGATEKNTNPRICPLV